MTRAIQRNTTAAAPHNAGPERPLPQCAPPPAALLPPRVLDKRVSLAGKLKSTGLAARLQQGTQKAAAASPLQHFARVQRIKMSRRSSEGAVKRSKQQLVKEALPMLLAVVKSFFDTLV